MKAYLRLAISFVVLLGTIVVLYTLMTRDEFRIAHIELEVPTGKTPVWLGTELKPKLAQFAGRYTWDIDLEQVLEVVAKDRRVQNTKVSRKFPDRLRVEVVPHKSLANILGADSSVLYPLSGDGGVLPPVHIMQAEDAPILRGDKFLKDIELRNSVVAALQELPIAGSLSQKTISEIYFDRAKGLVFVIAPDGLEIILGFEDAPVRLRRARQVVEYLRNEQIEGRIVDTRFSKKVVVRLRNES